jgi:hypothetical protein
LQYQIKTEIKLKNKKMGIGFGLLAIIFIAIGMYILICKLLADVVKKKVGIGHEPFWWIFFLGVMGIIIVILLDIRDWK